MTDLAVPSTNEKFQVLWKNGKYLANYTLTHSVKPNALIIFYSVFFFFLLFGTEFKKIENKLLAWPEPLHHFSTW